MDAAAAAHLTTEVLLVCGLLSFCSSVADAVTTTSVMVVTTAASGLSCYSCSAEMVTHSVVTTVAATQTAVATLAAAN